MSLTQIIRKKTVTINLIRDNYKVLRFRVWDINGDLVPLSGARLLLEVKEKNAHADTDPAILKFDTEVEGDFLITASDHNGESQANTGAIFAFLEAHTRTAPLTKDEYFFQFDYFTPSDRHKFTVYDGPVVIAGQSNANPEA